jgi:WD40 repeat protein
LILLSPANDLAVSLSERGANIINVAKEIRVRIVDGHFTPVGCVSNDGRKVLAVASRPRLALNVIDLNTGSISSRPLRPGYPTLCTAIAISPDSNTAFLAYRDGAIYSMDLPSGIENWHVTSGGQRIDFLKVSADGVAILVGGNDGTLQLWRATDHAPLRFIANGLNPAAPAALSPRGDMILCNRQADNAIGIWDMALPTRLRNEENKAAQARQRLVKNPSDIAARAALVDWYEMCGGPDWANRLLDDGNIDAEAGIAAARCRWQASNFTAAVADFDGLLGRNNSGLPTDYVQACRDAAARGE